MIEYCLAVTTSAGHRLAGGEGSLRMGRLKRKATSHSKNLHTGLKKKAAKPKPLPSHHGRMHIGKKNAISFVKKQASLLNVFPSFVFIAAIAAYETLV